MLHGEQYLEVVDDLPVEGTLTTNGAVIDVTDKKSGAVVVVNCNSCFVSLNFIADHLILIILLID